MPKMYDEFADWWPLLSDPAEYVEEAAFYLRTLTEASSRPPATILELGSGGGNNAAHMKAHADLVLVEPADGMRAVSRRLNPECEHLAGDMRTIRLDRQFDAVFVHDAVVYMTTEEDLRQAFATAFVHCRPGGVALFAPDVVRETFRPSTDCGGSDGASRAMRYLEWTWDPDPADSTCVCDYTFVLRHEDGSVQVVHDRHVEGLFSRSDWLRLLGEAGFARARAVPFDHSELELGAHEVFVAVRAE